MPACTQLHPTIEQDALAPGICRSYVILPCGSVGPCRRMCTIACVKHDGDSPMPTSVTDMDAECVANLTYVGRKRFGIALEAGAYL